MPNKSTTEVGTNKRLREFLPEGLRRLSRRVILRIVRSTVHLTKGVLNIATKNGLDLEPEWNRKEQLRWVAEPASNVNAEGSLAWSIVAERFRLLANLGIKSAGFSLKACRMWRQSGLKAVREKFREMVTSQIQENDYGAWVEMYDTLTETDRQAITARISALGYQPLISIIMPVYNADEVWLRLAIESVCRQLYPNWELCIADDHSNRLHVRRVLEEYSSKDQRIKVVFREARGHISAASNSAIELAQGEFIALLDHDDELPEHALYMVVEELNAYPQSDLIYSDEDKLNKNGARVDPHFKPDWSPDLFYSYNLVSHLGVYRRSLVNQLGGFNQGYEGSQDYDLALRAIEQIPEDHIRHIPYVLYHWREVPGSAARVGNYADQAARNALRSHLRRRGVDATVTRGYRTFHRVIFGLPAEPPVVSVIVTFEDSADLPKVIDGVLNGTDYPALELIIVDNPDSEPTKREYLRELHNDARIRVIPYHGVFNLSAIYNLAAREARGQILALLNSKIRVMSSGWLSEMVSHAVRPEIGVVGAKLYYKNETIQHAGIVLGMCGIAGHAHRHVPRKGSGYYARAQVLQNYSAVSGACLVIRRDLYHGVGGLNELDLPIAYNDLDLCLRIQQKGYRILWTPYAELYHLESASPAAENDPDHLQRITKEEEFMKSKWKDRLSHDPYYSQNLTLDKEDLSFDKPKKQAPWKKENLIRSSHPETEAPNNNLVTSAVGHT